MHICCIAPKQASVKLSVAVSETVTFIYRRQSVSNRIRADTVAKNNTGAPPLLRSIKLLLIPTLIGSASCSARHLLRFFPFHSLFLFLMLCTLQGGKWRFRLSRLSPDGGLWKALNCLQNVPLKDVKYSPLLCCSFFLLISPSHSLSHQIVSG